MLGKVKNIILCDDYWNSRPTGVIAVYEKDNGETGIDFRAGNGRYDTQDELRRIQRMGYGLDENTNFSVVGGGIDNIDDAKKIVDSFSTRDALYHGPLIGNNAERQLNGMAFGFDDSDSTTCLSQIGYYAYDAAMSYLKSPEYESDSEFAKSVVNEVDGIVIPKSVENKTDARMAAVDVDLGISDFEDNSIVDDMEFDS